MIKTALNEAEIDASRISVIPIPDTRGSHSLWVARVKAYCDNFDAVFSNQPLVSRLFREAGFTVEDVPFYKRNTLSGIQLRQRMIKGNEWEPYVPKTVAKFLKQRDLVKRIRELSATDET